jgi:hypothetical protein
MLFNNPLDLKILALAIDQSRKLLPRDAAELCAENGLPLEKPANVALAGYRFREDDQLHEFRFSYPLSGREFFSDILIPHTVALERLAQAA